LGDAYVQSGFGERKRSERKRSNIDYLYNAGFDGEDVLDLGSGAANKIVVPHSARLVPDGGSSLLLLGASLMSLGFFRRSRAKVLAN
jgi:hypothetical protein